MCAFASKQVCFRSDFIIIMNYLTSYVFFLFSSTMDAARDRETWTQKVEAVVTCWGAGVYISVTYKCTHAHTHLYARPSFPLLPEPLLHQEKKKQQNKRQSLASTQEQKKILTLFSMSGFSRVFFFQLFLHLCSLEESGAAGKGKRSNLCLHHTPRGHSKAVSCPDCPDRCRTSWCPSQSRRRCPLAGTFPAVASGWLWDESTDLGSQNDLSSPQKDPARHASKYTHLTGIRKNRTKGLGYLTTSRYQL